MILNAEERWFFKSKNDYDKVKLSNKIALLEARNAVLSNDLNYYKNAYLSNTSRYRYKY